MNQDDEALNFPNPRLLATVYFGVLAVVATVVVEVFLYALGVEEMLPIFQAVLLAVIVAACFGALYGKKIVHSLRPYRRKAFLWGFLLVLTALPVYDLVFLYLLQDYHAHAFENATFGRLVFMYLFVLMYSFILAGLWLAIAAGFAAMYLRGQLVYDILHSKTKRLPVEQTVQKKTRKPKPTKPSGIHLPH